MELVFRVSRRRYGTGGCLKYYIQGDCGWMCFLLTGRRPGEGYHKGDGPLKMMKKNELERVE